MGRLSKSISYLIEGVEYEQTLILDELGLSSVYKIPSDVLIADEDYLIFNFVGLLLVNNKLLIVLPKYFNKRKEQTWLIPGQTKLEESRLLMQVLRKYSEEKPEKSTRLGKRINISEEDEPNFFDGQISIALELVENYIEYGYWQKTQEASYIGTGGRINWRKTIERTLPLITEDAAIYSETYIDKRFNESEAIILKIHRWAIRSSIETYNIIFPELNSVWYDTDTVDLIEDLGDIEYLILLIEKELKITYRDSHIQLLKQLIMLLDSHQRSDTDSQVVLFGVTKFEVVWEAVCKKAFNDRSKDLERKLPIPKWIETGGKIFINKQNRIIPDAFWFDDQHLLIIDAKYYLPDFKTVHDSKGVFGLSANPGGPDIIKQLVYQSCLCSLLHISPQRTLNAFVIPRTDDFKTVDTPNDWFWGYVDSCIPIGDWKDYQIDVLIAPPHYLFSIYLGWTKQLDSLKLIEQGYHKRKPIES